MTRDRLRTVAADAAIVVAIATISVLHYVAPVHAHHLHDIYRRLYYLPIIFAAFRHGLRGGVAAAALVCAAYAPHAFGHISHDPATNTQKILEMVLYVAVGLTTGSLVSVLKGTQRRLQRSLDQLRAAEDRVVQSARLAAVGRLSAGLAHEIRNPLASIKGSAEILADDYPAGHPKHRLLRALVEESERLNNVLSRFLSFARPQPPRQTVFDIADEIEAVASLARAREDHHGISIATTRPAPSPLFIRADHEQIRQVLLNLVLNACQAAAPAGEVRVSLQQVGDRVSIRVEDSGPGFTREALENAFTPFYTTKEAGTGLGLAISHRIVEAHRGTIRLMNAHDRVAPSAGGNGGVVEIELPLNARATE